MPRTGRARSSRRRLSSRRFWAARRTPLPSRLPSTLRTSGRVGDGGFRVAFDACRSVTPPPRSLIVTTAGSTASRRERCLDPALPSVFLASYRGGGGGLAGGAGHASARRSAERGLADRGRAPTLPGRGPSKSGLCWLGGDSE